MAIDAVEKIRPLVKPVKDFSTSFYHLARGNLSYTEAIEQGELWTQAGLKLSLTAVMFFSYRFAIPMGNPLLTVSLMVVNTCIHPAANIEALFLTYMSYLISSIRQTVAYSRICNSLMIEMVIKGAFPPGGHQLYLETVKKIRSQDLVLLRSFICASAAFFLPSAVNLYLPLIHVHENDTQTIGAQKIKQYFLWLDRKIITASKIAAPCIASFFRYQQ